MIFNDPVFGIVWAAGLGLHIFIYRNRVMGDLGALVIVVSQAIAAGLTATILDQFGAAAAFLVVGIGNAATFVIVERIDRKRRTEKGQKTCQNLERIAEK